MLDEYPMILTPADVMKILNLPKNQTYNLFRSRSFPSELIDRGHIREVRRLQQGFPHEPGRNHVVLQQGLPAPETVPGLQKEEKGGEGA